MVTELHDEPKCASLAPALTRGFSNHLGVGTERLIGPCALDLGCR